MLQGAQDQEQVLIGGECDATKRQIAPTVLAVDRSDDPLMRDELFGPLLPMIEVEDLAMAMEQIRSQQALALYLSEALLHSSNNS